MKTIKRVLGVVLALAIVFALALPAMAAEPVITGITPSNPVALTGKSITLTVTAEGENLSYQWYNGYSPYEPIAGATSNSLTFTGTWRELYDGNWFTLGAYVPKSYRVVVSNEDGEDSRNVYAEFYPGLIDSFLFEYYQAIRESQFGGPTLLLNLPKLLVMLLLAPIKAVVSYLEGLLRRAPFLPIG